MQKFNLKVEHGDKIALVGPSGSGKSTVVQLLMRFYEPESGQILVNGHPLAEYDLYECRRHLGLVMQEPVLFKGNAMSNLNYSQSESLHDDELTRVLGVTQLSEVVKRWKEGLQKEVGQKGTQVSGGQKQRIAIARALLRKPEVILFDEATSALDAETEKALYDCLQDELRGRTWLSVAHRLSTIIKADRILMMRDGQVIEQGSYQQLIDQRGCFYEMAKGIN